MSLTLRALLVSFLITEVTAVFFGTSVWAILNMMHAGLPVIYGAEALTGLGMIVLAVMIFRKALACERDLHAETQAAKAAPATV
ncbi:MAG: hypothetical protein ACO33A_00670 [Hyphomonas sp.]